MLRLAEFSLSLPAFAFLYLGALGAAFGGLYQQTKPGYRLHLFFCLKLDITAEGYFLIA